LSTQPSKITTDIKIGAKKIYTYVIAATIARNQGATQITLRARGKFISKACDVAEILKRTIGLDIANMLLTSKTFEDESGRKRFVSELTIVLTPKQ